MKTSFGILSLAGSASARILSAATAVGLMAYAAAAGVQDEAPVTMDKVVVTAPKTHTLFMGADISVNLDRDLYPVRDVVGSSWVVAINGQNRVISAKEAPLNLKVTPTLKLTEGSATIVGFKREAAYSYANDPSVLLTKGMSQASAINTDFQVTASNAQHLADTLSNKALGGASMAAASDNQFGEKAQEFSNQVISAIEHPPKAIPGQGPPPNPLVNSIFGGADQQELAMLVANQNAAAATNQTANGDEPSGRIATMGLDAMNVEFYISSAKPLHNPYVVTMTRFHAKGSSPGTVQTLIYAKALDPIYTNLSHVQFSEDGFPFDYVMVNFQLHIYDHGVEIATNESANRVELTRDEAFEYVKIEYISAHKGDTLPATPSMGKLPAELPNRLATGKYAETFYVKVSKDGLADEPFIDVVCSEKIDDPFLQSVVKSLRFKPALDHGKPVEGIAALNLGKLTF
jgi:hypothetical protein